MKLQPKAPVPVQRPVEIHSLLYLPIIRHRINMASDNNDKTYRQLLEASQGVKKTIKVAVAAAVAAGAGAGIGTLILPGIGTAIGGMIGVIAGAMGAELSQAKSIREILQELNPNEREQLLVHLTQEFGSLAARTTDELRTILNHPVTIAFLTAMLARK